MWKWWTDDNTSNIRLSKSIKKVIAVLRSAEIEFDGQSQQADRVPARPIGDHIPHEIKPAQAIHWLCS